MWWIVFVVALLALALALVAIQQRRRDRGVDAVMIVDETSCRVAPDAAPVEVGDPERDRNVLGNHVVTDAGVRLGTVTDLIVRAGGRGEVVGYEVSRDGSKETWFVPRPAQLAVSGDALLVPNDVEQYVRADMTDLGDAIAAYRGGRPR
jgi:uncharacterized protein YrrD